ncbi:MAG: tetratricopeptide repeat protein [Desulfobacteraceae bacterium]
MATRDLYGLISKLLDKIQSGSKTKNVDGAENTPRIPHKQRVHDPHQDSTPQRLDESLLEEVDEDSSVPLNLNFIYGATISSTGKPLQRPPKISYFINRKNELDKLLKAIQPGKVVTLWGPGGMGKSVLAAEAVWTLAPENEPPVNFPDGIIYHNFYNQPNIEQAFEAIVRAYGQLPKPTPKQAAKRVLSGKRALLVLDGVEAIPKSQNNLEAVLQIKDNCGVLVVSCHKANVGDDIHELLPFKENEAVKLLLAWSKDQTADSKTLRQICSLIGQLPLAVGLVGRYLDKSKRSPEVFLAWLNRTPLKKVDDRQRREKSVPVFLKYSLTRMSESASQILGVAGALAFAPFDTQLLAIALTKAEEDLWGPLGELINYGVLLCQEKKYEISHPLIHTYLRKRISVSPETIENLAAYYSEFVREQCGQERKKDAGFGGQREHIMRVLAGCAELSRWKAGKSLAEAIQDYPDIQSHLTERTILSQAGLNFARKLKDPQAEGIWLNNLGSAYNALGEHQKAIDHHSKALVIHKESGYQPGAANASESLGSIYSVTGEFEKAVDHYSKAQVIHKESGYQLGEADALGHLGSVYSAMGEFEKAVDHHSKALVIHKESGYQPGEADALGHLGSVYSAMGEFEKAVDHHSKALVIHKEHGNRQGEATTLGNLGLDYSALGESQKAIDHHSQALVIHREIGDRKEQAANLDGLGQAYSTLGEMEKAIEYLEQALVIDREIGYQQGEAADLGNLGNVYSDLGDVEKAINYHSKALLIYKEMGYRKGEAANLDGLGLAYSALGKVEKAIDHLQQALRIDREIGYRQGEAADLGNLGNAYRNLGEMDNAIEHLQKALIIFEEMKSPTADTVRQWLAELISKRKGSDS